MDSDAEKKNQIDFKPMTSGLGFKPFSEPYAPVSKTRTPQTGTGAVAAGPARFVLPTEQKVQIQMPTRPLPPKAAPKKETRFGWAYLTKRVSAYFLDSLFNTTVCGLGLAAIIYYLEISYRQFLSWDIASTTLLFFGVFNWALIVSQEIAFGTSLAKRFFNLELRAGSSAIFLRAFFFAVSFSFFGLGILWALFDKKKRCWHDLLVDAQPIERPGYESAPHI